MSILNTLKTFIPSLEPKNKYTASLKDGLKKLLDNLEEEYNAEKYNEITSRVNKILEKKKLEAKDKEKCYQALNNLFDLLEKENKDIIITGDQKDRPKIEEELDNKIEQYNKYNENNPMQGISFCNERKVYRLRLFNRDTKNKDLKKLAEEAKKMIILNNKKILVNSYEIKNYKNELISYLHNGIEFFDILHILHKLKIKDKNKKYNEFENKIGHYILFKNNFNGYCIKNLIEKNVVRDMLHSSNKISAVEIAKIIGFDLLNEIKLTKEQRTLIEIKKAFNSLKIIDQYVIYKYRIDIYFPDYRLAIECDENDHKDRDPDYELLRENKIKEKLNCKLIRFNPDDEKFDIFSLINEIFNHVLTYNNE